jgi:hypothetical protein
MRCVAVLCCGLMVSAAGCEQLASEAPAQFPPRQTAKQAPQQRNARDDLIVGEPIRSGNLTIFPISSRQPRNDDPYITLDEGLRAKTVEVLEVGAAASQRGASGGARRSGGSRPQGNSEAAGSVNRVSVINRSGKPLYLMPGEIIMGGKQDRTIGNEMIVESGEKPVEVEVYCVEHGRWSGRDEGEGAAMLQSVAESSGQRIDRQTAQRLAKEARSGKFVASAGSLSSAARRTVQEGKGQADVWNEVGMANARSSVQTQTDTFTANYADEALRKDLKAYLDRLQSPVAAERQAVGVIVAINGKVTAADVFQSTPLFLKLWPKLLKSYALDAATAARQSSANRVCSRDDAQAFLRKAFAADVKKETDGRGGLAVSHREGRDVVSFSARAARGSAKVAPAAKAAGGFGAFGGSVHDSAYAK